MPYRRESADAKEKGEVEQAWSADTLDEAACRRLLELASLLHKERETCAHLVDTFEINLIEETADTLGEIGSSYGYIPLVRWAERLKSQAHIFEIDALPRTLDESPRLIADIEAL
ncbi:MAG: hypothetical protein ACI906_002146 [Candidatus Latescibacterota bacterium]